MGMESCLGKTVMAGIMGGGLGAMFGLFMASVCSCFGSLGDLMTPFFWIDLLCCIADRSESYHSIRSTHTNTLKM